MVKSRIINIAPMRIMFGMIVPGEDIERLLMKNFTIPNTKDAVAIFLKEYDTYDAEALFHFMTYFITFLYKVAPIDNTDFINSINIKGVTHEGNKLMLEIEYELD